MATYYSILAWKIPWTEESGGLQSMGLQRVRQDWVTNTSLIGILVSDPRLTLIPSHLPDPPFTAVVPLPVHLSTAMCFPQPPLRATDTNIRFWTEVNLHFWTWETLNYYRSNTHIHIFKKYIQHRKPQNKTQRFLVIRYQGTVTSTSDCALWVPS